MEPQPALPLAASMDDEKDSPAAASQGAHQTEGILTSVSTGGQKDPLEEYKKQAKQIMREMNKSSPVRCTITAGQYSFQ